jgi:Plasmid pRiA4b ORF-3-like protein
MAWSTGGLTLGISPMIWRRLLVRGDSTIADLYHILQMAMGWTDTHLHQFRSTGKSTALPRSEASASVTTLIRCALQTLASGWVNVSSTTMILGTAGSTSSVSKPSGLMLAGAKPLLEGMQHTLVTQQTVAYLAQQALCP